MSTATYVFAGQELNSTATASDLADYVINNPNCVKEFEKGEVWYHIHAKKLRSQMVDIVRDKLIEKINEQD